ncbi:hypothetical protein M0802_013405 [Mischocyttarus mexicanus]|nr:hypothetical protein M0802_013405 [Mischocyttarus mexicanus]
MTKDKDEMTSGLYDYKLTEPKEITENESLQELRKQNVDKFQDSKLPKKVTILHRTDSRNWDTVNIVIETIIDILAIQEPYTNHDCVVRMGINTGIVTEFRENSSASRQTPKEKRLRAYCRSFSSMLTTEPLKTTHLTTHVDKKTSISQWLVVAAFGQYQSEKYTIVKPRVMITLLLFTLRFVPMRSLK